jgi:hypothetical protein
MVRINLAGVRIVRKKLANGQWRAYHYAYTGGPLIWKTGCDYAVGSPEYVHAYESAHHRSAEAPERPSSTERATREAARIKRLSVRAKPFVD